MSNKQDRQGARTPADLERKYAFEKSFAEIMGVALDAQKHVEESEALVKAELSLKLGRDENDQIVSMLNASANVITIKGDRVTISSTHFDLDKDGTIKATAGEIGGCVIKDGVLQIKLANIAEKLTADKIDATELKVDAANVTGKLKADQIDATDLEFKQGTVGSWHLGKADISVDASTILSDEYALYTDEIYEKRTDSSGTERTYTYRVYLTAKGVYVDGRYDTSYETGVPYYANKTWLDICES